MIDITNWLGELTDFQSLELQKQMKVVRILEFIQSNPASTLPYFKKVMGMSHSNKHIKKPEFWVVKNMVVANVLEYKPSKFEIVEGGFRGFNANILAIYLATKTRFRIPMESEPATP